MSPILQIELDDIGLFAGGYHFAHRFAIASTMALYGLDQPISSNLSDM